MPILLLLAGNSPALAQDENDVEAQAISAVIQFYDAVVAADEPRLNRIIAASEQLTAQREGRRLFIDLILARRRLEEAAVQRFGAADGALLSVRYESTFITSDRQGLARAIVLIDEAGPGARTIHCRILADGITQALRVRRSPDGEWRVILEVIDRLDDDFQRPMQSAGSPPQRPQPSAQSKFQLERLDGILNAINATTERVRGGQLASAGAACSELTAKIAAIAEEWRRKRLQYQRPPWR